MNAKEVVDLQQLVDVFLEAGRDKEDADGELMKVAVSLIVEFNGDWMTEEEVERTFKALHLFAVNHSLMSLVVRRRIRVKADFDGTLVFQITPESEALRK